MKLLDQLNIVITRPIHQSQELTRAVVQLGGMPILFPTIEIRDTNDNSLFHKVKNNLTLYHKVIFCSVNAATKVISANVSFPPHLPIYAMGKATADLLSTSGIKIEYYPQQKINSESLLQHPTLQDIENENILIFSGEGGRNLLLSRLANRGAHVTKVAVYQRVCPKVKTEVIQKLFSFKANNTRVLVCLSAENLRNLHSILRTAKHEEWLDKQYLLTISPRIARYAKFFGFKDQQIILSEQPSTQGIIETLISWYAKFRNNRNLSKD